MENEPEMPHHTHTKLSPSQDHPRHAKGTASKSSVG